MNLLKTLVLGLFLILISPYSNAAIRSTKAFDLDMQLSLNGKLVSSPRVLAKNGETALITQTVDGDDEQSFIEITALDGSILGNDGIMMTFTVGKIGPNGERKILSKPQVFAQENQKAEVTVEQVDGDNKEMLSLTVLAKSRNL